MGVKSKLTKWFGIERDVRQGLVMSLWLLIIDDVLMEVKARVLERYVNHFKEEDGRCSS